MTRFTKRIMVGAMSAALIVPLVTLSGCNMGQYQEPAFEASQREGDVELRDYKPVIAAEVKVSGERKEAISNGFRLIADYIFGNNAPNTKIAMTAPVIQQAETKPAGEKIAMTAPVIQQGTGNEWIVQFIMPSEYTLATLPKPNNPEVKLREVPGKQMAVIRFSGSTGDENIAKHTARLREVVKQKQWHTVGEPVLAFYDPPWTLPFMRRNEVMLEIAPERKKR